MPTADLQEPITFTEAAVAKVKNLIEADGNPNLKLRIYIVGGGCSGFQYGFAFDEKINDDDIVITKGSVTLLVDALSAQYLVDAVVDYSESLQGSQFIVRNPNAETTCGCGSSFSLKESSEADETEE
jgi:iron-sulfur cluster insertion protein